MSLWDDYIPTYTLLEAANRNQKITFNSHGRGGICPNGQHALGFSTK